MCHLVWEIDGRASTAERTGPKRRIRRLRICWNHPNLKQFDAYLILAAHPRFDDSDIGYRDLLHTETQFLGRRLGRPQNKRNLIREFLRLYIEKEFIDIMEEPYFGVIDIENDNLTALPIMNTDDNRIRFKPFATVSYVWGPSEIRDYITMRTNIQSRRKSGGLAVVISSLPKALRQSIQLVQGLGIRYIWIDALCIVQDSSHSWNLNARSMHLIYGNSTVTICAADGEDVTTGLLAIDDGHESRPSQLIATYAPGMNLVLHQPPEVSIKDSAWNKRAWTFQERLLSKRCVIFSNNTIYFQCRSTSMSEDIFAEPTGCGWSLDLIHSPLQMMSQFQDRALWFYIRCVFLYTQRKLHEPFDILAAFSGMCKFMEYTMNAPFLFGLPTSHFDFALLWQPISTSSRLEQSERSNEPKYKHMKFPSWSWCGWESNGIEYRSDLVDGCLTDVCTWLSDHTWIDWHIRDGHGTLRHKSTNDKWKGYMVRYNDNLRRNTSISNEDERDLRRPNIMDAVDRRLSLPRRARSNTPDTQSHEPDTPPFPHAAIFDTIRYDRDGRWLPRSANFRGKPTVQFTLTLPEDPYNVRTIEHWHQTGSSLNREFPDQPFLQFFTWSKIFHVVPAKAQRKEHHGSHSNDDDNKELRRCHIIDRLGDKCGSIVVDAKWLEEHQQGKKDDRNGMSNGTGKHFQGEQAENTEFRFIAISEAKSFTKEEFPDWTYYIPKERSESEWDLFFVLLIEESAVEGFSRRVALGKVFKTAFNRSDNEWKEIILGWGD
ncbi:heterokaryon incompatibility protein-domain-containing protein [Whalleya microplaca]|nr:heterokaryon incompatibility protein-domain-containing protein [Whalleya microplaca]